MSTFSDMGPELERMLTESRERAESGFTDRMRWTGAFSAAFLVAAIALAVLAPAERAFDPVLAAAFVAAYSIVARVEFDAGAGTVVPTQMLFVPMLLLLPTPLAPLLVAVALVFTDAPRRALTAFADAWFSVLPALVLVLAGAQLPEWGAAPFYLAAFVVQLGSDALITMARARIALGARPAAMRHELALVYRVDNAIINKPGKLDDAEWAVMKTHTVEGQRMLERVGGALAKVGVVVRASHERWDGGGYPDGLVAEAIPLAARIVSACDAYNAMTTDRSYRRALPISDAVAELERCAGSQFDPDVVRALVAVAAADAARQPDWQLSLTEPGPAPGLTPFTAHAGTRRTR